MAQVNGNGVAKTVVSSVARDKDGVYVPSRALELIPEVTPILHMFLSGQMREADEKVKNGDPASETLYYSIGQCLIEAFKAFMSFESDDLQNSIAIAKRAGTTANAHRRHVSSLASRITGFVSRSNTGVSWIKGMTDVERHAELCYQEHVLLKAVLGILYSGEWFQFIKEALNLRSANISYRYMAEFLRQADAAAGGHDTSIDPHFRSGVLFGVGMNSLILSLLPNRVVTIVQLFGFQGQRTESLDILYSVGGWSTTSDEPSVSEADEGTRRPITDVALLIFHLLISKYTYKGVDLSMAKKILDWNMQRYPDGVFYLFARGRILSSQSQPDLAKEYYLRMIVTCQDEFKSLQHISLWELSCCAMALYDMTASAEYWQTLLSEANWSKCVYTYGLACSLAEAGGEINVEEAKKLMVTVPGLMQRIAGKSIPLEKYAARKSRKFEAQGYRLMLPGIEFSYHLLSLSYAPRRILVSAMLPEIEAALAKVKEHEADPSGYYNGRGYWDDYCLGHFLQAVCLRFIAYADKDAAPEAKISSKTVLNAEARAFDSFQRVLDNAQKIEVDHYLVYYAHYELGRLYACSGNVEEARKHLDIILSGKILVQKAEKGKYSMESALVMRTHAAFESLGQDVS